MKLKKFFELPDQSQNYWNPFRDWNLFSLENYQREPVSLKTTETLLGIETS